MTERIGMPRTVGTYAIIGPALVACFTTLVTVAVTAALAYYQIRREFVADMLAENFFAITDACLTEDPGQRKTFMLRTLEAFSCDGDVQGCVIAVVLTDCAREISPREAEIATQNASPRSGALAEIAPPLSSTSVRPPAASSNNEAVVAPAARQRAQLFILVASQEQRRHLAGQLGELQASAARNLANVESHIDVIPGFVGTTHVRYFHNDDRDRAHALTRAFAARFPDIDDEPNYIGSYESQPDSVRGLIELWVGPNTVIGDDP